MMTFSSYEGKQQLTTADTGLPQVFCSINSDKPLPIFFNEKVLFPSLEELKLSSICKLKRIWHNQLHGQSFGKLASLTIELCENLSHVFPSNSTDWLCSLNKLKVVECPSLEELFEPVSLNAEKRQKPLVLSALEKVKLLNLPKLRDIVKSNCKITLAFPSLIKVKVRRCHSLPYLFSTATAKTLDELEVLDVSCCDNLRSIIVMEEGKEKIIETLKFRHLSTLKLGDLKNLISFSSVSCASEGLHPLFDEKLAFPKLEELQIKGIQLKELWHNKILAGSFCRLKVLEVKQCHNLLNVVPSFMWGRLLHCVESLTVESCNLIEGIHTLEGLGFMEREAARNSPLRKLSLCDLPNLTRIWKNGDLLNLCFHNLTSIRVEGCPHLRNIFTMCMATSLGQLQHLVLGGCEEMEYVVSGEEEKPKEVAHKILIPQLVTMYLHNMPKLISFCQGKHISEWPSLKEFTVEDCQAVEVIIGDASCKKPEGNVAAQQPLLLVEEVEFPEMESMKISHMDNMEKIWSDELASNAFSKLKTLIVEYCPRLSSIFSPSATLVRFQNLEKLTVTNCDALEVLFHMQELNMSGAHFTSNFQLNELFLAWLPKLKHIWSGLPQGDVTFGRLRCMRAESCESLQSLFPSPVAKTMTQLEELVVCDCGVEKIITEEDEGGGTSAGDLFFPRLTKLQLLELPKLGSFCSNSHTSTWPFLKELQVRHCGKMRSISFKGEIQSCQGSTTSEKQHALFYMEKVIPQLEKLRLAREDVVMMPQQYVFGNLRELLLGCYHDENVVFPSNFLLHGFPNLEELSLDCSSFEVIFPEDAFGHGGVSLKALGNLKRLRLTKLRNLRRVRKDGFLMAEILKQIEYLYISECPRLSIVFPTPTSFHSLTELELEDCDGLVHVGTCSAMTSPVHLTRLILRNCAKMEVVVTYDGNGAEEISFSNLEVLILDLP
ncbi:uncharacterized protein LOC115734375 [Rhodamnia argentea]|uniref:Uncharacterized protein LOC115734375 n=1 Tax=Rhodamnia argentea TaxID=178133 RepID=A0ABM3HJA1_9MYRT|nr:uncharacterized protein LOC115734375 [Rhodamnia argentea]